MKVTAEIKVKKELEIQTKGITILSSEEYEELESRIPPLNDNWWLRSPGYFDIHVATVMDDGHVNVIGCYVGSAYPNVRPALILESSNLQIGDNFKFGNHTFTVFSEKYALCDDSIGKHCFRKDWKAKDANDYEKSDVKRYIEDWYEKSLEIQKDEEEEEDRDEI